MIVSSLSIVRAFSLLIILYLHGSSQKVLTDSLRSMEEDGIITRTVYPEVPPRVEYALSDLGESMRPIIKSMEEFGLNYKALSEIKKSGCNMSNVCCIPFFLFILTFNNKLYHLEIPKSFLNCLFFRASWLSAVICFRFVIILSFNDSMFPLYLSYIQV